MAHTARNTLDCQAWSWSSVSPDQACLGCDDVPESSCPNGCLLRYVPLEKRCDGVADCRRANDESGC